MFLSGISVGRPFGIPVRLHPTILLSAALLIGHFGALGLFIFVVLFASIATHELGHALVARRFGIATRSIHLHMLGGTAMLAESPRRPRDELWIAAAGPAVSLTLALGFAVLAGVVHGGLGLGGGQLLGSALGINLMLGLFNLVPALPMDGGRMLRAFLALRMPRPRATRIAGKVSRVFGVLFILGGLLRGQPSLALIGIALFFLIGLEERAAAQATPPAAGPVWPPRGPMPYDPGDGGGPVIDVGPPKVDPRQVRTHIDPWQRRIVIVHRGP